MACVTTAVISALCYSDHFSLLHHARRCSHHGMIFQQVFVAGNAPSQLAIACLNHVDLSPPSPGRSPTPLLVIMVRVACAQTVPRWCVRGVQGGSTSRFTSVVSDTDTAR